MNADSSTAALMRLVASIERDCAVTDWTADGVRLWPLLRIDAFSREWLRRHATAASTPGGALEPLRRLALGPWQAWRLDRQDAPGRVGGVIGASEVLFVSDGVSFAPLGGRWVEKFCDPLRRRLAERGLVSAMWTLGHRHHQPRFSPALPVQHLFDRAKLFGVLRARLGRVPVSLPDHARLLERLTDHPAMSAALVAPEVASLGARLRAVHDRAALLLRRLRPRLVMIVSYYSLEAMAIIRACRGLGIPTVDLQHGVQGALHPAYAGWPRPAPNACHELLPDRFWVWDGDDARRIDAWAEGSGHAALVGGNPWMDLWARGDAWPGAAEARRRVQALRADAAGHPAVLVSLQHGVTDAQQLDALRALMALAEDGARFWVRLHPAMLARRAEIRAALAALPNAEIDQATDLPLPALLTAADVHMTHCSSVVIEAAASGVPTLLTSPVGAELFAAEIEAGRAAFVEGAQAQWQAIRSLSARGRRPGVVADAPSGEAALEALVALARPGRADAGGRV